MKTSIGKDEGEVVWMGGIGVVYKIPGTATDGAFSVIEHRIKPGTMTPPHRHNREHEFSYVLEGVLGAKVGDAILHARPGEFAIKPKGVAHAFWNEGPGMLRFLEFISPAGFEQFFREGAALLADGPPDEAKMMDLSQKYGMDTLMEDAAAIMSRFKVSIPGMPPPP
jgi:quercetin dioxygenase-like cupin family protein